MGLINRIAPKGKSLDIATELAKQIASHPQCTMLGDRRSAYEQFDMSLSDALNNELSIGLDSLKSQEYLSGATAFEQGQFRHGSQS